jgi:hypothetical protein
MPLASMRNLVGNENSGLGPTENPVGCLRGSFFAFFALFCGYSRLPSARKAADQFAVAFPKRNPANRADKPNTIKVTINTAPVTICCSSGVTPAKPNAF